MSKPFRPIPEIHEPPENGIFYTVDEFARLTGVHRNTVLTWIYAGRVKAKNPGGRSWHISKEYYNKQ